MRYRAICHGYDHDDRQIGFAIVRYRHDGYGNVAHQEWRRETEDGIQWRKGGIYTVGRHLNSWEEEFKTYEDALRWVQKRLADCLAEEQADLLSRFEPLQASVDAELATLVKT